MVTRMRSQAITAEVVDGVVVIEWYEHRPDDGLVGKKVLDLLGRSFVDAYVAVDRTDKYLGPETQEAIERLAEVAADSGIERVGLVGEAIKGLAAKRAFTDSGLEVHITEDKDEAIEWARSARHAQTH